MNRREFIGLLGGTAAWPFAAHTQQAAGKLYRIGYITAASATPQIFVSQAESLRRLGWVEGKNVLFELRYGDNRLDRLAEVAAELVSLNVDVIIATGSSL
jgi:putative ABC transport system substrate-binding protein